jgi:ankyrin repeat protein
MMDMDPRFHAAQAALAAGDVARLAAILAEEPGLAKSRSTRSHPTLLQCLVLTMPPVDGLEELIGLLAQHGAELTGPLVAAASSNNVRAINQLLDLGAEIDGADEWSPLEEALYWGHETAVSLLLERGATARNLRTYAALGDMEAVARCFDQSGALTEAAGEIAWPFERMKIDEATRRDPEQIVNNALVSAAAWGHAEALEFLLDHGAGINCIPAGFDYSGTPLHYAALNGRWETVNQLLRHGADPSLPDTKIGKLAEDWASHGGHSELAEHLRSIRTQVR